MAQPNRRLATFNRGTTTFTIAVAAPARPDDDGQTPAVVLSEIGSRGRHEITVTVHELPRVARLFADLQRLFSAADQAPLPPDIVRRRTHRAFLEKRAANGDAMARSALDELDQAERG